MSKSTRKFYKIFVDDEYYAPMIALIREHEFEGLSWPNSRPNRFELNVTQEELMLLRLRIPCSLSEPEVAA